MSTDIKMGRKSRKIMTVMAAVVAVAMMLAVPIFVAVDSDAAFTNDNAGYNIELKDPTDAQLTKVGEDKTDCLMSTVESEMEIFNTNAITGVFGAPTATASSFELTDSLGMKTTDDNKIIIITVRNIKATDVKITMDVVKDGKLISPSQLGWTDKQKAAADAIAAYIGADVKTGDKVEITGTIKQEAATQTESTLKHLEGNNCVMSKNVSSSFAVIDIDLTLKLIPKDGEAKEIKLVESGKGTQALESTYDYKEDDVKVGTKYDLTYSYTDASSGDVYYKVDGKEYSLKEDREVPDDQKDVAVTSEDIVAESSFAYMIDAVKVKAAALPASEDGMKVDKTYDAAQSSFDNVVMDAVGNDLLKLILIIGGVILGIIVLIIILIIVLVVLKKKKKKQ